MEEQVVEILSKLYYKTEKTEQSKTRDMMFRELDKLNLSEKVVKAIKTGACGRLMEEKMAFALRERPMDDKKAIQLLIKALMERYYLTNKVVLLGMLARW